MKMKIQVKSIVNNLDTMNVRNVDGSLNKEGPIEHMVEVNIYYQGYSERTEIDVIGGQK